MPPMHRLRQVQFALNQIIEISTKTQTLEMHGWWRFYWTDPRLAWDADRWNTSMLIVPTNRLWVPDVVIYETVSERAVGLQAASCYPDGSCSWLSQRVFKSGCPMNLASFPFDTQRCNFTIGSNSYDQSAVDVVPRRTKASFWVPEDGVVPAPASAVDLSQFRSNQEFLLLRVVTLARPVLYSCCPVPYPVIVVEFTLMRQALTYVYGVIVPLILATTVFLYTFMAGSIRLRMHVVGATPVAYTWARQHPQRRTHMRALEPGGINCKESILYVWGICRGGRSCGLGFKVAKATSRMIPN